MGGSCRWRHVSEVSVSELMGRVVGGRVHLGAPCRVSVNCVSENDHRGKSARDTVRMIIEESQGE